MRILIENGGYSFRNMGDWIMLQVGVRRLREAWPDAEIHILTLDSERCSTHIPKGIPATSIFKGRSIWFQQGNVFGPVHRLLPTRAKWRLSMVEERLRERFADRLFPWIRYWRSWHGADLEALDAFYSLVKEGDCLVATGGGYLTDTFARHALTVARLFGLARHWSKPYCLFGQGIGPFDGAWLQERLAPVFRSARLIALREGRQGVPLLRTMDVNPDTIMVTGDDAVEPAYERRPDRVGSAIGFNVRPAKYAQADGGTAGQVAEVVRHFAESHSAAMIPIPISQHAGEECDVLPPLFPNPEQVYRQCIALDTPEKVIRHAGTCRIVVTGSYHAGVFALAQGIPVVGLAKSEYYIDKFLGLADMFQIGCTVLTMDSEHFDTQLQTAMAAAWDTAEETRDALLKAARRQIALSKEAYARFVDIVNAG